MAFKLQNVIGVVENPGQVSTIRTINGDRRVHKFQVTDGHVFVRVTLLGSILDSSNVLFTANLQAPVIIVLAGVRIKRIPGDEGLDNYHLTACLWTQIFINMETDAASDMRNDSEVNAMFDHLEDLEKSRTDWRIKVWVTRLWPTSNAESGVVKGFNLILLDDDVNIIGMIKEWEPASRVPTRYEEKKTLRFKLSDGRFRLLVLADDNSFASTVVLTDRVVKRLAQTIVTNLMNSSKEAPISEMRPVLKNIAGKNVTVKISLSKYNVAGDSSVSGKKDAEYSPITKFPSFEQSQTDDYVVCLETPTSSDSVSKKIKMVTNLDLLRPRRTFAIP
ncbi:hypothetical protein ACET3Z_018111 [Daucus carota]